MKKLLALAAAALFCIGAQIEFILPKEDVFSMNTADNQFYWSPSQEALDAATIYRLQNGVDPSAPVCKTEGFTVKRYGTAGWADVAPYWFAVARPAKDEEPTPNNLDYGTAAKATEGETVYVSTYEKPGTEDTITFWRKTAQDEDAYVDIQCNLKLDTAYSGVPELGDSLYYICAPADGKILTSHFACDNGHTMVYEFDYQIEPHKIVTIHMSIQNAYCWYCCRDKGADSEGAETVDNTVYFKANTKSSLKGKEMTAGQLLVVANNKTAVTFSVS